MKYLPLLQRTISPATKAAQRDSREELSVDALFLKERLTPTPLPLSILLGASCRFFVESRPLGGCAAERGKAALTAKEIAVRKGMDRSLRAGAGRRRPDAEARYPDAAAHHAKQRRMHRFEVQQPYGMISGPSHASEPLAPSLPLLSSLTQSQAFNYTKTL